MQINKKSTYALFIMSFLLIILDQATKLAVKGFNFFGLERQGMSFGELIPVIGDFLQITYVENAGMAFGITFGGGKIFLSLFSVVAGAALAWYLYKLAGFHLGVRIGAALILAGAAGNLIDRVFYGLIFGEGALFFGKVVDFIKVDIPDVEIFGLHYTHWPVFNVADSCVTVGVAIMLIFHNKIPQFSDVFGRKPKNKDVDAGKTQHTGAISPGDEDKAKTAGKNNEWK